MATGKIRADSNFINPYPHAKIRIRARARNPQRVENDTRTRYPRIPVCPRITHMPARRSKTCRTKTPALAASAAGLPESGLGAGVAQPSSAAVVGPGCGRRSPQAWGPGHRRRGAWALPARALGCGVEPHHRGGLVLTFTNAPDLYTASARFVVAFPLEYSPKVYQSVDRQ